MNELQTPSGYVEYPRDPRFRPIDGISRFEQTVKGSLTILTVLPFVVLLSFPVWSFNWVVFAVKVTVGIAAFVWLSGRLAQIFRAQGWRGWMAVLLALLPCAVGIANAFLSRPVPLAGFGGAVSMLVVQSFVASLVPRELRRVGLNSKRYCITKRTQVDEIVAALRMRERQVAVDSVVQ